MHLIEMELYGFKSFAKRTRIQFSEDITAIVGPNGSGKSNIVDAIMWALGESSVKQLRGNKMEDVIFSGTDRQKGVNYAEVVLTFDNKDGFFDLPYEELSISRKYFRSGESQYTINKKRVRQKDIREIFLDTGIGKNGYSFIGQGQIDEILSTRPQDRRHAFEEAAGVSKYKLRKEETVRNLAKTSDHISRIDDIYFELLSRRDEMEDKREKATALHALQKDLHLYTYSLALRESKSSDERRKKITESYERIEAERDESRFLFNEKEKEQKSLEESLESFTKRETELRDELLVLVQKKEQLTGLLQLKNEQQDSLTSRLHREKEKATQFKEGALSLKEELENVDKLLEAAKIKRDVKQSEIDEMADSLDKLRKRVSLRNEGEKSRKVKEDQLKNRRHDAESRKQALDYLLAERRDRLARLNERKAQFDGEGETLKESLKIYSEKEIALKEKLKVLGDDIGKEQDRQNSLKESIKSLDNEAMPLKLKIESIARERDYLVRLKDNHEGFQYAVKQFLKMYGEEHFAPSVIGPVAESFVFDPEYALAISTALGFSGQNIILKDDHFIGDILSYLKHKKLGRITFLPINNLKTRTIENGLEQKSSVAFKVASECIRCSDDIRPVARHLLGRILLVASAEDGKRLAKDLNYRYRIVTKDGEVFQSGGAVTGGQSKNTSVDLYNRDREIDKKNREKSVAENELRLSNTRREELLFDLEKCEENLKQMITHYKEEEDSIRKVDETLRRLSSSVNNNVDQTASLENEIRKESEAILKDNAECEEKESILEAMDKELTALREDSGVEEDSLTAELEETRDRLSEEKIALQKLIARCREVEIKKDQTCERYNYLQNEVKAARKNIEEINEELQTIKSAIDEHSPQSDTLEDKKLNIEEELKMLHDDYGNSRKDLKDLGDELNTLRESIFSKEKELVSLTNRLEDAEKAYSESTQQLNTMDVPEGIEKIESESITSLRQKSKKFSDEINRIGPVDGDALEQYEEWNDRVLFLSDQREDLLLSKEKLEKMIRQLDREMRKQLEKAVLLINGYFNEIFKQLFQGGEASLAWEEGDILEAGILISARPPGKKLQSLSLLSGGERSMTAVALLFALLKMRQSPFCIVDEIDAALDDANIRRYSQYVKHIDDMQFIMITHRKQTMEMANQLYGVTMEEKGISRILFLELEEVEKHVGVAEKEIQ